MDLISWEKTSFYFYFAEGSEEYIQDILEIPSEIKVQCIIAIGYPGEEKPPRSQKDLNYDRVFYNAYRN